MNAKHPTYAHCYDSLLYVWRLALRTILPISPAKAILVHEQGQTPGSLKRCYENVPLGKKWLKYAVS